MAKGSSISRKQTAAQKSKKSRAANRQTGKNKGLAGVSADRKRTAKPPGERTSKTGKKYNERRKNRSDKRGSKL